MHTFFAKVGSILLGPWIAFSSLFAPTPPPQPLTPPFQEVQPSESNRLDIYHYAQTKSENSAQLGASNSLPTTVALFETSLASKITSTATSMTLVSSLDKTGTALASSTYAFIIDEGTSIEEMVIADCTGTTCVRVARGISPTTGTTTVTALQQAHGRGASVKITDGPQLIIVSNILNGVQNLPNALYYDTLSSTTIGASSNGKIIPTKDYTDFVGSSGCANASLTVRGCIEIATASETASSSATGGTGAILVIPSSVATDTPTQVCNTSPCVLTTKLGGKTLSQTALDIFTTNNSWSGSQTNTATTTIPASNVNSNAIVLNGLAYKFPPTRTGSSTALMTDASGNLSWVNAQSRIFELNANANGLSTGTASTSLKTVTIPANTLGASNQHVRVTAQIAQSVTDGNNCTAGASLGSGTASSSIAYANSIGSVSAIALMNIDMYATSTTAEAITSKTVNIQSSPNFVTNPTTYYGAVFANVNLAAQSYLSFDAKCPASNTAKLVGYTVEILSQ